MGRSWASNPGNLFCTYLMRPNVPVADAAVFGFIAANAVAQTCEAYIGDADIKIKWPNDVQIGGAKTAGILLETGHVDGKLWLAVGIGINLISAPDGTPYPVTNLGAHIDSDDPEDIPDPMAALAILANRFKTGVTHYMAGGFASVREAWLSRAAGLGETVSATSPDGKVTGTLIDLTLKGELQVRLPDGRDTLISSGEVFLGQ